jgi:UDP-N-acetylmuramoyl-tripeptide--D-alanyl-D-alanine ligase
MIILDDVSAAVPQAVIHRPGPKRFSRAGIDTRDLAGGELFFAVSGARDGHDFLAAAVLAGAGGVVVSRELTAGEWDSVPPGIAVIQVPDTLIALQQTAAIVRRRCGAAVIAITGSAGKTTAKTLIAEVLAGTTTVLANAASFNNHLGVPLTLTGIQPEHTHVVSEIGTNQPGEIAQLTALVEPDVAVVTNVGFAHLGNFGGDQLALAREKTDLLRHTRPGGVWILNGDDTLLCTTAANLPGAGDATIVRVGFAPGNDLQAVEVTVDEHGIRGHILVGDRTLPFWLKAAGRHFAYAALLALAVGQVYGIDPADSLQTLNGIAPPPGRATVQRVSGRLLVIDDSYNASPDAMLSSLDLLATLPGTLKIAVLGQMGELGTASAGLHERVGTAAAGSVTHLITVGPNTAPLQAGARAGGLAPDWINTAESATHACALAEHLLSTEPDQDAVVLIKGARFTHMERVHLGLTGHTVGCTLSLCTLYLNCAGCSQLNGVHPTVHPTVQPTAHPAVDLNAGAYDMADGN